MKMIDRYVYAVTEHLPEESRDDVGKELRTNIEDMLPDNPTDQDIYRVLEELGNPYKLASEYNPKKRYLIGPSLYEKYWSVLKLVVGICITVFTSLAFAGWVIDAPVHGILAEKYSTLFADLISAVFEGAIQGALWVTIVFVILERSGVEAGVLPFSNKKWTPDDLQEVPDHDKRKISRGEIIVTMICTIFFTAVVYFNPEFIAIFHTEDNGVLKVAPLFNLDVLKTYVYIILTLTLIELGLFTWKFIAGRWNTALAVSNAVYNIACIVLMVVMINDNSLFNPGFFSTVAELTNSNLHTISLWLDASKWIFIAVFFAICIWDSIAPFIYGNSKAKV